MLPFAKNHTLIPMLFLRNEPTENIGNAMLPAEVLDLLS